jgi:hypothetical protein
LFCEEDYLRLPVWVEGWFIKVRAMDRGPNAVALTGSRPLALGNIVERDRCLQLCSDIHTELMKDLLEVASATVWIQKDKFSIESMASSKC